MPTSTMLDDDLSFMMERYLDGSRTQNVQGVVQPSPGQQSTDSGFISDASQQNILNYPDQLIGENSTFQTTGYDQEMFTNFGNYFEPGNDHCPVHHDHDHQHQNYYQQQQLGCLCSSNNNNNMATNSSSSAAGAQQWDCYNTDDLSQIVDQVLNSIDPQFCDVNWTTPSMTSLASLAPMTASASSSPTITSVVSTTATRGDFSVGKMDLCDNCGNILNLNEADATVSDRCKCCGHFLQRNNEQDNNSSNNNSIPGKGSDQTMPRIGTRICAVQPAVRSVGVVEPRVVVKIPWAKLKAKKKSLFEDEKMERRLENVEIELCPTTSETRSTVFVVAASNNDDDDNYSDDDDDDDDEIAKRMKNGEEDETKVEKTFSFTEKLPEHFREALRARKRSLEKLENSKQHFSNCCKRSKRRKKKRRQRRRRERNAISTLSESQIYCHESECENGTAYHRLAEQPDNATAYCNSESVPNRLKLVRSSNDQFKIEESSSSSRSLKDSLVTVQISPKDISSPSFLSTKTLSNTIVPAATISSTCLDQDEGFSRYRDTCLDFGDLVRQSKLKFIEKVDKNERQVDVETSKEEKRSKKHRHSKCKKHRHKTSKHRNEFVENESIKLVVDQMDGHKMVKEEVNDDTKLENPNITDFLSTSVDKNLNYGRPVEVTLEQNPVGEKNEDDQEEKKEAGSEAKPVAKAIEESEPNAMVATTSKCLDEKETITEVTKTLPTKFLVEKESDGKWLYCKLEGCHFWTRKQVRMSRHTKSHVASEDNKPTYQCPDCKLKISSLPKLLRHDRKFHTGFKDYECKICEAEVTDIAVHMRVHKSEKLFSCNICGVQFRHKNSLVRHLFQHSGERPFRCQNCESSFTSIHRMREHIKKRHPTSHAAQSIGMENNLMAMTSSAAAATRSYPPIAPAPAKMGPTTLLLQQAQQPQMTSFILPNGMIYLMNQSASAFQQPLLVSMPAQQPLFLTNPGLQALGSQFLTTGNGGPFFIAQPVTSQPTQIIFNGGAQSALTATAGLAAAPTLSTSIPVAPVLSSQPLLSGQTALQAQTVLSAQQALPAQAALSAQTTVSSKAAMSTLKSAPAPSAQLPTMDGRINFNGGSFRLESDDRLTFKGQNGETVKLDILERAILEIPNLANEH